MTLCATTRATSCCCCPAVRFRSTMEVLPSCGSRRVSCVVLQRPGVRPRCGSLGGAAAPGCRGRSSHLARRRCDVPRRSADRAGSPSHSLRTARPRLGRERRSSLLGRCARSGRRPGRGVRCSRRHTPQPRARVVVLHVDVHDAEGVDLSRDLGVTVRARGECEKCEMCEIHDNLLLLTDSRVYLGFSVIRGISRGPNLALLALLALISPLPSSRRRGHERGARPIRAARASRGRYPPALG